MLSKTVLLFLSLWCAAALAQSSSGSDPPGSVAELPSSLSFAVRQPVIDPAIEIRGTALVKELRRGGYVLYMRHATNGPGNATPDNPCPEGDSPLTVEGRRQAQDVGLAIGKLGIRIGKVLSSATCRTRVTGELVAGSNVELSADLNPFNPVESRDWVARRQALLNTPAAAGTNTLLVSHFHAAPNPVDRLFLEMAEVIVFSPRAPGRPLAVARVPPAMWAELLRTNDLAP